MSNIHTQHLHKIRRMIGLLGFVVAITVGFSGIVQAQQFIDHESPPAESEQADWPKIKPNVELSPEQVVRFQVEALAQNNEPYRNAGIEVAYRFTSPSNKEAIGSLLHFALVVYNPFYRPLLNHQIAHYGIMQIDDNTATQLVFLTTEGGNRQGYLFKLSRQRGGHYDGCWMTDSVLPLPNFKEA